MKKNETDIAPLMNIFIGLAQATRCCRQDTAFCGGVTFHQYVILDAAVKNKDLRISDLHGLLGVEKSTTTRLVNPLIANRFLTKEQAASDSRVVRLILTKQGLKKHQEVEACLADFFKKIMCNIPLKDQSIILQSVQTFIGAIKNASGTCNCCN